MSALNNYKESINKLILEKDARIVTMVDTIADHGGRSLLVGGAVRDLLLGLPVKDIDIEVHGLSLEALHAILMGFGYTEVVGKAFGVLRLHGLDVDWSLPRADAAGRKPIVAIDPHMDYKDAFLRRDLTINAMGIDMLSGALIDPFNGYKDLEHKILRSPDSERFIEDPLRFFRVMQFIARFQAKPDAELNTVCQTMSLAGISRERIEQEMDKMLLKSKRPSLGLRWLKNIGRVTEIFPELGALLHVPQNPLWHPEGDVFEHTMQAIDAAAGLPYPDEQIKRTIMYATLCHDLGKAVSTRFEDGRWRSHGHEITGVPLAQKLLERITHEKNLIDSIKKLVRYHMTPGMFIQGEAKASAYKRLAKNLAPEASIAMLALLGQADRKGRNGQSHEPLIGEDKEVAEFLNRAQTYLVAQKPEEPLLLGRDLLDVVRPGPLLGQLLDKAYDIQVQEGITDKEQLKQRIIDEYHRL